jgi:hypothetical protein
MRSNKKEFNYSIHNLITIESQAPLPELASFAVTSLASPPTIRLRLGRRQVPRTDTTGASGRLVFTYDDGLGWLGFAVRIEPGDPIEVRASHLLRWSPHVL